ncbi:hypothetical protein [Aneurinibacillus migulanus]|uniref:hypothetical protein n=1 Tax=Aneurinibacillus migulanus TaxID=47500 RepID=UPI000A9493F3|nr:hypothetical protein [Aneurinibacillus migulanus]MED0894315.1 hypothetical protein [Aneurinibacillus migulanus]MED1619807.1 hypothetical protein [Aneurinibacillus migulanus]GED18108.1 hypothetical protein AMI01nite_60990 [Aneurinibacillus migulanus]
MKTIYNQPVHDVKSVALYGGSIYLIFGIPLYIGLFDVLKSKVPPSYSGVIYIGCIILSGVLLTLLVVLLGGGKVQQLISSESSLFGILYIVSGVVFGSICLSERKIYKV